MSMKKIGGRKVEKSRLKYPSKTTEEVKTFT
jgi:hypothetical protein